ncbi:MAG: T9SS type A sorting domain-containing protein [Bacteroidia bacterium]|nr:T9SS type A sorting domain-containing protein [Bacteroidia bacterium]
MQSDSIIFGNIVLHKVGTSGTDFFIVKYDPAGTVVWAKNAGGRFGNAGKGITTDISGNAYVIGDFGTDSITFDNINYLYNNCTGNGDFFIVKYDPDGNAVWAQNHSGGNLAFGYGITSDGYNVYITGIFRGSSITFGGTTINNYSPYDVFIVKYNTNGNVIWARNAGGNDDDGGRGIAVDITGNVYVIGKYRSDSIYFGNIKLYNAGPSLSYTLSYLFIVKYDAGGNPQWAERGEGTFTEQDAIVVNGVDNLYVTGSFYDDPVTIGSTTLSNSGYYDIYVAHTYSFSPVISSSANVSCNGFSDGFATLTMNGGMEPFTYLWSNGQTTPSAINLTAGNYSVSITDINDCIQTSSVNITEPPAETAAICMVTVDSLSEYNVIVWDKSLNTAAESYTIYREIATDNYQPIAAIPYDSFSQFTDTVHALYFPNTGDPNEGTYRYKIQVLDTCGGFSEMSPYHNTIYMLNSGGIFYWTLPYSIENSPNPVTSYILMRDDYSTGDWHDITSVAGTQQTVSDPLYVIYQNTASWRVKTQWSINCTPTLKNTQSYNYSLSNIFNNTTGILENTANTGISVYPNPSDGLITIHSHGQTIEHIQVHNVLGEQLFSKSINNGQNNIRLNLSALSQGVYFLKVKMRNEIVVKKIMIK